MSDDDSDACSLCSESDWESSSVCDSDSQWEAGSVVSSDYESVASDQGSESWEQDSVASDLSIEEDLGMDEAQAGDEFISMLCEMHVFRDIGFKAVCVVLLGCEGRDQGGCVGIRPPPWKACSSLPTKIRSPSWFS